jgi:hypothetical protein
VFKVYESRGTSPARDRGRVRERRPGRLADFGSPRSCQHRMMGVATGAGRRASDACGVELEHKRPMEAELNPRIRINDHATSAGNVIELIEEGFSESQT